MTSSPQAINATNRRASEAADLQLDTFLKPGDGVLDLGANVGEYSARYAEIVGPTGYVLAVEPCYAASTAARERCAQFPWVTVLQVAAGAEYAAETTLYHDPGETARNSQWPANVIGESTSSETVRMVPLDFLAGVMIQPLKAIKIDAQGAEGEILKGARETLQRTDLTWQVELWPMGLQHAGSSVQAMVDGFSAYGWHPVCETWAQVIEALRGHHGHQSHDVILRHQSSPTE